VLRPVAIVDLAGEQMGLLVNAFVNVTPLRRRRSMLGVGAVPLEASSTHLAESWSSRKKTMPVGLEFAVAISVESLGGQQPSMAHNSTFAFASKD
jgi:hypothetical protein